MKQYAVRLPDDLYSKVKEYADKHYIDVSSVIKLSLAKFLAEEEKKPE